MIEDLELILIVNRDALWRGALHHGDTINSDSEVVNSNRASHDRMWLVDEVLRLRAELAERERLHDAAKRSWQEQDQMNLNCIGDADVEITRLVPEVERLRAELAELKSPRSESCANCGTTVFATSPRRGFLCGGCMTARAYDG